MIPIRDALGEILLRGKSLSHHTWQSFCFIWSVSMCAKKKVTAPSPIEFNLVRIVVPKLGYQLENNISLFHSQVYWTKPYDITCSLLVV